MSNNQVVIDTLLKKRDQLFAEQRRINDEFQAQINEVEDALDVLAGKSVWRKAPTTVYDDENPSYIAGNEDGI